MERGQWDRLKEPSLLLSNHPPLWEVMSLLKDVSRFSKEGNGVMVVMDAAFLKLANRLFGLDGIPVDVRRSIYTSGNAGVYLRSMIVKTWGEVGGVYNNALKGMQVVDEMRDVLESGRSVLLFPSGTGRVGARWKSGVGRLVNEIYEDGKENEIGVGIIAVGRGKYVLLPFDSLAELFEGEFVKQSPNIKELAIGMQQLYRETLVAF